jgi:hypothetical protein
MTYKKKGYNPWNKGKKLSKEIRKKMRKSALENSDLRSKLGKLGAKKRWKGHKKVKRNKAEKTNRKYTKIVKFNPIDDNLKQGRKGA